MPDSTGDDASVLPEWVRPFFENPGLTFGALLASVIIWTYIRGQVEDQVVVQAELKLNVKGEGNQEYIITRKRRNGELVRNELPVLLRGPKSTLEQIKNQQLLLVSKTIVVTEEMQLENPVEVTVKEKDLKLKGRTFPIGVHMAERSLKMNVTIQQMIEETRTISGPSPEEDRETFTVGEPAADYRIVDVVPQVDSVTIQGPAEVLSDVRIVPETPISVSGQASDITRPVSLTTDPESEHVKLSVQNVAITVKIASQLMEKEIEKKFLIASGPKLSSYLQEREWRFEPANRKVTITFELPKSIDNQLTPSNINAILILPSEEVDAIKDPTRPHTVSTEDFLRIVLDQSIQNRDRIEEINITPEQIKFVPSEGQ